LFAKKTLSGWGIADFGEMMMMQNAQMHQMVMQKLMLGNLGSRGGGHGDCGDCHNGCCSSHNVYHGCGHGCYDCYPAVRLSLPSALDSLRHIVCSRLTVGLAL